MVPSKQKAGQTPLSTRTFRRDTKCCPSPTRPQQDLGPPQPSIHWAPGAVVLGVKRQGMGMGIGMTTSGQTVTLKNTSWFICISPIFLQGTELNQARGQLTFTWCYYTIYCTNKQTTKKQGYISVGTVILHSSPSCDIPRCIP